LNRSNYIVELIDVTLTNDSGKIIFENMNFNLKAGETAIITGRTGSGKSSLVELLIGNKKPNRGVVKVFGIGVESAGDSKISSIRKKIGGVGGIFSIINNLTVFENCVMPLMLNGERSSIARPKVMQILTQLNLLGKKGVQAGKLSKGEKVLLMLGRSLAAKHPLMLIDEPLAGMVESASSMVLKRLQRLAAAGHSLIILTTGQTGLKIPDAVEYQIADGKLL